jgi:2-methylisocitrate lyase-like PEP mutase family enzyme
MAELRGRLAGPGILVAPGVYDALTASLATDAGARALYLSGAGIAYTRLGRPDIGLVTMSEVAQTIALIRDRVATPLIVDGDTGFGNALNTQRTVRLFEQSGADAIQLEDQSFPKRCGHLRDKSLIGTSEMVGKIKAAVDARRSAQTQIIARTDAIAVEGFAAAIERARCYREAGADVLFVEAPGSGEELAAIPKELGQLTPLMANMVEGGLTPVKPASDIEALGYQMVIFPGAVVRMIARAATDLYKAIIADGTSDAVKARMFDFDGLNKVIGTPDMLASGQRYEGGGS